MNDRPLARPCRYPRDVVPDRLSTKRFTLRRFGRRDTASLEEAVRASLPELSRWLPWAYPAYGRDDAVAFVRESMEAWRTGTAYDFAIRDPAQPDVHIGNISIWPVNRLGRSGEIGYWVRTDATSRGIATEATERLMQLGFETLGFHKIVLRIAVGNTASERVAAKLGFVREGVLREEVRINGRWVDHTLFSMLVSEFDRRAALPA